VNNGKFATKKDVVGFFVYVAVCILIAWVLKEIPADRSWISPGDHH